MGWVVINIVDYGIAMTAGGVIVAVLFVAAVVWRLVYLYGERKRSRMLIVGKYVMWRNREVRIKGYQLRGDKYVLANGEEVSYRLMRTLTIIVR